MTEMEPILSQFRNTMQFLQYSLKQDNFCPILCTYLIIGNMTIIPFTLGDEAH